MTKLVKYFPLMLIVFSINTNAEIHKEVIGCENKEGLCFYWQPKLPKIDGWWQGSQSSVFSHESIRIPLGSDHLSTDSIILARAINKKKLPNIATVEEFIESNNNDFYKNGSGQKLKFTKTIKSTNGLTFQSYFYRSTKGSRWEQVSYSEEKDSDGNEFYLEIILNSKTKAAFKKSLKDYEKFIKNYE